MPHRAFLWDGSWIQEFFRLRIKHSIDLTIAFFELPLNIGFAKFVYIKNKLAVTVPIDVLTQLVVVRNQEIVRDIRKFYQGLVSEQEHIRLDRYSYLEGKVAYTQSRDSLRLYLLE
jgi:hypothetical protein